MSIEKRDKVDHALVEAGELIGATAGRVVARASALKTALTAPSTKKRKGSATRRKQTPSKKARSPRKRSARKKSTRA
jgi:hypothetical protein